MFAPIFEDMFQPMFSDLFGLSKICQAIRLDGADDYIQLAERAIDPDGDIVLEFWTPASVAAGTQQVIIGQSITANQAGKEFEIFISASTGNLGLTVGGNSTAAALAGSYLPSTKYGIRYSGTTLETYQNGQLIRSVTFTRGTAREPTAQTFIGTRAGSPATYFQGLMPDIKINGTYYPLADADQAIQLPTPSGLGGELITQQVLENPAAKGSQWTYLGAGRWQYVGDGTFNALRFIEASPQPASGFLEFEVESISGVMRCAESANSNPVNPRFSSTGVFRYYYTSKENAGGSTGNTMIFVRDNGVASCIIKNISFKPLGTSNPATIFNSVPEQWEQIPCNLRPSENELLTPQIQQEPQDQSVIVGATPSFTVAATVDVGTVEFQWQADTGAGFIDMPSETNATLTLPPVGLVNNGNLFRVQVRANGRSVVSRSALLTVDLV